MKISEFLSENFKFLVVKFSIPLNRRVFVMKCGYYSNRLDEAVLTSTRYLGLQHE